MKRISTKRKTSSHKRMLSITFILSALTGIGLHIAGHGNSHEIWHFWAITHVITCLLWFIYISLHIKKHWNWYQMRCSKGIKKSHWLSIILSLFFLCTVATGILLLAFVEGANSAIGLWHYASGMVLTICTLFHIVQHKRLPKGDEKCEECNVLRSIIITK